MILDVLWSSHCFFLVILFAKMFCFLIFSKRWVLGGKPWVFFTKKQSRLNSEGRFLLKKKYLKFWKVRYQGGRLGPGNQCLDPAGYRLWRIVSENVSRGHFCNLGYGRHNSPPKKKVWFQISSRELTYPTLGKGTHHRLKSADWDVRC